MSIESDFAVELINEMKDQYGSAKDAHFFADDADLLKHRVKVQTMHSALTLVCDKASKHFGDMFLESLGISLKRIDRPDEVQLETSAEAPLASPY